MLLGSYTVVVLMKIWLTLAFGMRGAGNATHDDLLFMRLAEHLIQGEWLGPYKQYTLAKGPFFSIWIALCFYANIPLLLSYQLLHLLASGLLVVSLRSVVTHPWARFGLFALLVFEPSTYSLGASWVIRMGVYVPLTMICVACLIGLMTRLHERPAILARWSTGLGIALALSWITREESIWLLPAIVIVAIYGMYMVWKTSVPLGRTLAFLALPFGILGLGILTLCSINYAYYGVFNTVEFKNEAFVRANGALMRVKHDEWNQYANVPKDVRLRIYEVSPTFAKLKPFLEGPPGIAWGKAAEAWLKGGTPSPEDIRGGFFVWALRDAATSVGAHESAVVAEQFYNKIANEINAACADGRLECRPERASMTPPWRNQYLALFTKSYWKGLTMLATLEEVEVMLMPSSGPPKRAELFQDLGRARLNPFMKNPDFPPRLEHQHYLDELRLDFLGFLNRCFKVVNPFLVGLGCIAFAGVVAMDFRKRTLHPILVISTVLLVLILLRLAFLAYISVTSFEAMKIRYLLPLYPFLYLVIFISLFRCGQILSSGKQHEHRKTQNGDTNDLASGPIP